MRARVHKFVETTGMTLDDKKELKDKVRQIIYRQLHLFNKE